MALNAIRFLLDTRVEKIKYARMRILYNILLWIIAIPGLVFFLLKMLITGKYRHSFLQKLGFRQKHLLTNLGSGKRIWLHAVSVGEVTAAVPIVAALKKQEPDLHIIFSTSTETGQAMARNLVQDVDAFIYFPLDISPAVNKMLNCARPDVFVLVETELWPNFLASCRKRNIKVVMVNGRISPRSFKKYRRSRFFWKGALKNMDGAGMITAVDAQRIEQIGLEPAKIQILGNAKYDALAAMVSADLQQDIAVRLQIRAEERFFVAGSTHPGEEEAVVGVFKKILAGYPDFKLILVPRHIERSKDIMDFLNKEGFADVIPVSEIRKGRMRRQERVMVVDVIGELFKVYSLATVVFCGGSLVPRGGQNILEAAAWGKVIFYGPSMEDFSREAALLEDVGAGICVSDAAQLEQAVFKLLADPEDLQARGERGRAVVKANMGAARRYAKLIMKRLGGNYSEGQN